MCFLSLASLRLLIIVRLNIDLLHSYLGLSSLGLFNEEGLDAVDPLFCTSKRVRARLETFDWWNGVDS